MTFMAHTYLDMYKPMRMALRQKGKIMERKKDYRWLKLLMGPVLFVLCTCLLPSGVFPEMAQKSAVGTIVWMAFWWITGPVDFAVTAFLPIALNGLFSMVDMSAVIQNYASETILLLLGASILTISWEETGLDKRIAASFLALIGSSMRSQIIFWYLLSAALSAVLPNAVVCATVTPIAVSMLRYVGEGEIGKSEKGSLLLLTIVYAAGVGGLATPLGGAMNLVTVDYLQQLTGTEYFYVSWVVRFLPIFLALVVINILYLLAFSKKGSELGGSKEYFRQEFKRMPPMDSCERASFLLFVIAAVLAFTRQLYQDLLPGLKPAYVFIICAIISFLIKKKDGQPLLRWKNVQKKIIWDLIFIFAGGLAAGTLMNNSGAAAALGDLVANMGIDGGLVTIFVIFVFTLLLSDVTSNTATAAIAMPIVISITQGAGLNPIPYIYVASVGVNLSFMLPTSIRAIPVGYGLSPQYMLRKGIGITVVVIVVITLLCWALLNFWPMFGTI